MSTRFLRLLTFAATVVAAAACDYHHSKQPDATQADAPAVTTKPGFQLVQQRVLSPRCYSCHGNGESQGDTTLDTYAETKAKADDIRSQVFSLRAMPQGSTLTTDQSTLLKQWLDDGAPEEATTSLRDDTTTLPPTDRHD